MAEETPSSCGVTTFDFFALAVRLVVLRTLTISTEASDAPSSSLYCRVLFDDALDRTAALVADLVRRVLASEASASSPTVTDLIESASSTAKDAASADSSSSSESSFMNDSHSCSASRERTMRTTGDRAGFWRSIFIFTDFEPPAERSSSASTSGLTLTNPLKLLRKGVLLTDNAAAGFFGLKSSSNPQ